MIGEAMAKFLVTYHAGDMPHDPEAMTKAREAFMQWAQKTGGSLADPGAPVKATKTISSQDGVRDGQADGPFTGWSVIEAPDADSAAQVLADHPFIGRGGILQISEPVEFPAGG
jgi:hypothetical protein